MRKALYAIICIMLTGILASFSMLPGKNSKHTQPETPQGYKLITSDMNSGVFIYGKLIDNQPYYNQVLVKTPDGEKSFDWKASEKDPILIVQDITQSGKKNVIIVFVTAFGTGAYESQIHVLDKALNEIKVENPIDAVQKNVKTSIIGQEVVFKSDGKEYRVRPAAGIKSPEEALVNLKFGSQVTFAVKDNKLVSGVSVQISPYSLLGEFIVEYSFDGGKFVPKVAGFKAN